MLLVLLGVTMIGLGFMPLSRQLGLAFGSGGAMCVLLGAYRLFAGRKRTELEQKLIVEYERFFSDDPALCLLSDAHGDILQANKAACRASGTLPENIALVLDREFSGAGRVALRLRRNAELQGSAQEDVRGSEGMLRLVCTALAQGYFSWRIETLEAELTPLQAKPQEFLPSVVLGRHGTILYMNERARDLAGKRLNTIEDLFGTAAFKLDRVQPIKTTDGPVNCLVTEISAGAGRQELALVPTAEDALAVPANNRFFDELPVPLLKVSAQGVVLGANKSARDLLGSEEIVGENVPDLLEGLGRSIKDWLGEAILGRAGRQSEFLRVRRVAHELFVQVILKPAVENGETVLVAVLNDATELKTLEAQFVQSQKMQAIGQLAGGVAHDFNNLLTAISGHCDLLMLRRDVADPDFADLEQINQNANRAAALVGQLLAFSRKQTLRPEVLDLHDVLSDLTHLLNRLVGETITLEVSHGAQEAWIKADKRQIEQVVMNLVVNARDAMPRGGTIRVETEALDLTEALTVDQAEVPPGPYETVKVFDEGCGIPADKIQKIFEPFFTTKRTGEGTGLGLSTAYGIVKQTGGFIFADSEPGGGSTFTLIFPRFAKEVAVEAPPAQPQQMPEDQRAATVLLVEDEAPVRAFASRALKLKGYQVIECESGEDALETLSDDALHVDLFLTDVVMPGLKGPEWVARALETRPEAKVIYVSGYTEDAFRDEGPDRSEAAFLQKPFSLADLAELVGQTLLAKPEGDGDASKRVH